MSSSGFSIRVRLTRLFLTQRITWLLEEVSLTAVLYVSLESTDFKSSSNFSSLSVCIPLKFSAPPIKRWGLVGLIWPIGWNHSDMWAGMACWRVTVHVEENPGPLAWFSWSSDTLKTHTKISRVIDPTWSWPLIKRWSWVNPGESSRWSIATINAYCFKLLNFRVLYYIVS